MAGSSQYFRAENPADACADWQRATERKVACDKVGEEVFNGRHTVKYLNKMLPEWTRLLSGSMQTSNLSSSGKPPPMARNFAKSKRKRYRQICLSCPMSTSP